MSATLIEADPATLVVGANVRIDARLDRTFVASIRERGVLVPIVAYRDEADQLVVLHGQRRTLAAVDAGRPHVPVFLVDRPGDADRLVDQVSENEHRESLTLAEQVGAYEQLAALGLSAGQIAKRTATKKAAVAAGLAVAGSAVARGATSRWEFLSLDQAAVLAEFEDDGEAVKRLTLAAKSGHGFDHVAQLLRDARAEAALVAEATEQLSAAGIRVVLRQDWRSIVKRLAVLTQDGADITPESHASCPGHAACVTADWVYPESSADADGSTDDGVLQAVTDYVCTDYSVNGHTYRYGSTVRPAAGEQTESEREAARVERRDVIDSNKAWVSAETVRRDWLRGYLARKTAPKGAALFVADGIARAGHAIESAMQDGHRFYLDLLGLEHPAGYDNKGATIAGLLVGASEARAQMVALGLLLAGYEASTGKHSWRTVSPATARYLRFIESQGYELADVERRACGDQPVEA